MKPDLEKKIEDLEIQLKELEGFVSELREWRELRERQQISEPLDEASQIIIDTRRIKT